jgi:PleD family two-component response regulator
LNRAVNGFGLRSGEQPLTLSIGITEASPEEDAIRLIARADEALYQAKSAGRDCMRTILPLTTFPDAPIVETARLSPNS